MTVAIQNKNQFITEAAKVAMHALITTTNIKGRTARSVAEQAREYALELWRVMRVEA